MTEETGKYEVQTDHLGLPKGTLLKCTDPGFQQPTFQDVRTLKEISGMTGKELCTMLNIGDQRTFRKWTSDPDTDSHRQIPYSAWRILILELGLVENVLNRARGIDALPLSTRTKRALNEAGIRGLDQLVKKTHVDLLMLDGFGKRSLSEVVAFLEDHGMELKGNEE